VAPIHIQVVLATPDSRPGIAERALDLHALRHSHYQYGQQKQRQIASPAKQKFTEAHFFAIDFSAFKSVRITS